ncbi:MAG: antibiotic biosynthesis monooxygenase [Alphaproteobacteria bacterium]|nr:antibiotic biosynthesis monooxygenase [Alphaproteobacteria bacterium]
MYVVTVEFVIKQDQVEAFAPLMAANAAASVRDEAGCSQFDVCWDPEGKPVCFLYEIYDDATAFQAHLASAHFKSFDAQVTDMVAEKSVRIWIRKEHNQ